MTVEEIIAEANSGNADAALAIAEFLRETGEPDWYDKALPWYEKAANGGSYTGLQSALVIREAKAESAKGEGNWDEVVNQVYSTIKLCDGVFSDKNMPDEVFSMVDKKFRYACYLSAFERCVQEDFQCALSRIDGIEEAPTPLMWILKSVCLCGNAAKTDEMNREVLQEAYKLLSPLESASLLEQLLEDADGADQFLLMKGLLYLALILRNVPISNIQRAYDVLQSGKKYLSNTNAKRILEEELSHYQQKIFGGLQYV